MKSDERILREVCAALYDAGVNEGASFGNGNSLDADARASAIAAGVKRLKAVLRRWRTAGARVIDVETDGKIDAAIARMKGQPAL